MRVISVLIISTFILLHTALSQSIIQTVKGKIVDVINGSAIVGANISIQNSNPLKGISSNDKVEFIIDNVPVGKYRSQIQKVACKYYDIYFKKIEYSLDIIPVFNYKIDF